MEEMKRPWSILSSGEDEKLGRQAVVKWPAMVVFCLERERARERERET
jgi:hypothetical protein